MNGGCFILCTLDNSVLTGHYGCTGQVALEMYFHCHVNTLYETLMDGRHLVVAKGYSDDVYSKPSCLALISTMFYFAISQHRHIQIPARNWKWHHPPPTPPPKPDSTDTIPPSHEPPTTPWQGHAGACRMQDFFALQNPDIPFRGLRLGSSCRSLPWIPKAQCH